MAVIVNRLYWYPPLLSLEDQEGYPLQYPFVRLQEVKIKQKQSVKQPPYSFVNNLFQYTTNKQQIQPVALPFLHDLSDPIKISFFSGIELYAGRTNICM